MRAPGSTALRGEAEARRALVVARRRATGLLAAVTVVFLIATIAGGDGAMAWVQAGAEGSMVGGLADWFAVVALFRRPLGLPIPHTAVVVARKDSFGATMGAFVQDNLLTADAVGERLRAAGVAPRLAAWARQPEHAERIAAHLADVLVAGADAMADEDVARALEGAVRTRVERTELAPLAGRALTLLTADGRHDEVVSAALRALDVYVDDHRATLGGRFRARTPWWIPGTLEQRVFDRLLDGARGVLAEMAADRDHPLRRQLDARVAQLAEDLRDDPGLRARGEQLKADLLGNPQLRAWTHVVWRDLKAELRAQAGDAGSDLRLRLADAVAALATRVEGDPVLAEAIEANLERAARTVVERFEGEIAELVSGTIQRWDAEETASRLELLLGRDLQFIRINGTVVGALAGVALHAAARLLG